MLSNKVFCQNIIPILTNKDYAQLDRLSTGKPFSLFDRSDSEEEKSLIPLTPGRRSSTLETSTSLRRWTISQPFPLLPTAWYSIYIIFII